MRVFYVKEPHNKLTQTNVIAINKLRYKYTDTQIQTQPNLVLYHINSTKIL